MVAGDFEEKVTICNKIFTKNINFWQNGLVLSLTNNAEISMACNILKMSTIFSYKYKCFALRQNLQSLDTPTQPINLNYNLALMN